MTNPNHKLFDEFKKKYDKILNPIVHDLLKANLTENNINSFLNTIFGKYKIEQQVSDVIIDLSVNAFAIGGIKTTYDTTKKWLLKNHWNPEALSLSKTIHKNIIKIKSQIGYILKEELGQSVNWQKSAQKIYKIKDIKAGLPKYMEDLVKQGKKVLQDPTLINDFNKKVKKYQKQINKLSNLGYKNPRLQKAYQNIITQVQKGSKKGLEAGIERAVKAKTKYFAERITRTEIANAYGNAVVYNAQKDKRIVGVKSVLSARHKKRDVCDLYAQANLYHMGKGVFPKKKVPLYTYHPN